MQNETLDTAIAAYASKTAYVGAGVTGAGWWLSNAFFGWVGVGVGLAGLGINWYYRAKADRRNQREYEARMRAMGQEP